ncbi:hypothetical protein LTR37_019174 [Vermiconidia calcicola]|uniref:Uncharacterized protein n=1 Tax=Vermiconidia calcicola TaxID=1690605 RepID=A0ACC3MEP8_9PEZI|nr:hypothetical protein LTR37_019174 [Vermiconidia calcicola]
MSIQISGPPIPFMDDVNAEVFTNFVRWLYAGSSPTDSLDVEEIGALDTDSGSEEESQSESQSEDHKKKDNDDKNGNGGDLNNAIDGSSTAPVEGAGSASEHPALSDRDAETTNSQWYAALDSKRRVFGRMMDLYIFAARYHALNFRTAAILTLQRCIDKWVDIPCPIVLKHALDHVEQDGSLFRFLAVCTGHYTEYVFPFPTGRFATLPSDFLAKVIGIEFARLDEQKYVPFMEGSWCEFHEHKTEAERKTCECNRPKDADVKREREARRREEEAARRRLSRIRSGVTMRRV